MPKTIKIDLNDYEQVKTKEELEGHTSIILVLKESGGVQLPDLYYRKPIKVIEIEDVDNAVWFKDIRIAKTGSPEEYSYRVDWWFDNAIKDEQYRQVLNQTYNRSGFDIKTSWETARNYLKRQPNSTRKTYLASFVWKWMSKGINMYLNRSSGRFK